MPIPVSCVLVLLVQLVDTRPELLETITFKGIKRLSCLCPVNNPVSSGSIQIKSSVKSFLSSIILITITIFDIDVNTILLQYLFSQKTHTTTTQHSQPTQPEYRGSVCECGGTQRTPSLGWAGTLNTRYTS